MTAIKSQLEDLAAFLRGYAASIDASPARLQEVEDRLALLERLKRKHGPTLADVIARHKRPLRDERSGLESLADRLRRGGGRAAAATAAYLGVLGAARALGAPPDGRGPVRNRPRGQLTELAMEHTRFEVRFQDGSPLPKPAGRARGIDVGEFYRLAESRARTSGRSHGSSRAARCPVSCWE